MRLAPTLVGLTLLLGLSLGLEARAGIFVFDTESTATQMISSPLLGGAVSITAYGPQQFTIDTTNGTANVTSEFHGSDFPDPNNPGQFLTYDLYNTLTTGAVTTDPSGGYDIAYHLLFELKITSGSLAGLTFDTQQDATFAASNIPGFPFPAGTSFSDPSGSDAVGIYVGGNLVGTSFDRVVTINQIVPEPSSLTLAVIAVLPGIDYWWRRRR
jgi:hypothetical protein